MEQYCVKVNKNGFVYCHEKKKKKKLLWVSDCNSEFGLIALSRKREWYDGSTLGEITC